MNDDEILKLALEVGFKRDNCGVYQPNRLNPEADCFPLLEAFYRAAFNAGRAASCSIKVPTETMEQEFQRHWRKGYNAGLEAAAKKCDTRVMATDCASAIRALEKKP